MCTKPYYLASFPGPTQILSSPDFLHDCEIKSGWGLGTRLLITQATKPNILSTCINLVVIHSNFEMSGP